MKISSECYEALDARDNEEYIEHECDGWVGDRYNSDHCECNCHKQPIDVDDTLAPIEKQVYTLDHNLMALNRRVDDMAANFKQQMDHMVQQLVKRNMNAADVKAEFNKRSDEEIAKLHKGWTERISILESERIAIQSKVEILFERVSALENRRCK